jgi:anti-sigma factor RsiW
MRDFTPEDLISYLYGETDNEKTACIKAALDSNWALREKLSVLKASMDKLDKAPLQSPSTAALDAILAYARTNTTNTKVVP